MAYWPVTQPAPRVSSSVLVPKKDGRLPLCLDRKDLNRAILREHYPLPTIEEVATRLYGGKCFTILDARPRVIPAYHNQFPVWTLQMETLIFWNSH